MYAHSSAVLSVLYLLWKPVLEADNDSFQECADVHLILGDARANSAAAANYAKFF
jgi:hypothetical protein